MKILHVITGLGTGGAETSLYKLLLHQDRSQYQAEVVSLTAMGAMGERIQALGVPVRTLGMRSGLPNPVGLLRLVGLVRASQPDIVQTWMYHADLFGGVAAWLAGRIPVIWGIRHGALEAGVDKQTTIWVARVSALLSRTVPRRIVACAETAARSHAAMGYAADKLTVIPNGFDTNLYRPDPEARRAVRAELGIPKNVPVVGLVGRFHPVKDHRTFIRAAGIVRKACAEARFVMCGSDVTGANPDLRAWMAEEGVTNHCHLLGPRSDGHRVMNACDIGALSSRSEGFPNVVGEMMACGLPCVVTEAGDAPLLVGQTGYVVPIGDDRALGDRLCSLIAAGLEERARLGQAARDRVVQSFRLDQITASYEALYRQVVYTGGFPNVRTTTKASNRES